MFFVLHEAGEVQIDESTYSIRAGDVIVFPAGGKGCGTLSVGHYGVYEDLSMNIGLLIRPDYV